MLKLRRQEIGTRAFARGYQQNALSDAELLFPHFEDCIKPGMTAWDIIERDWATVAGLDLAGKARRGTCLIILAVSPGRERYRVPVSATFGAWNAKEITDHVVQAIRDWHIVHTKIEDNSLQDTVIEMIELVDPNLEIAGFTTSWNKRDPDIGLPSLDREFERGMWLIPDPHADREDCDCGMCKWITQMKSYPAVENADGVMAAWFAREAAKEFGPGLGDVDFPLGDIRSRWRLEGHQSFGSAERGFNWRPGEGRRPFRKWI